MSELLEPNRIQVRDIPVWIRESWSLLWRKPVSFFCASIIFHIVAFSIVKIAYVSMLIMVLICYIFVLLAVSIAEAADHSRKIKLIPSYKMVRNVIVSLSILTGIYVLIYLISAIIYLSIPSSVPSVDYVDTDTYFLITWFWSAELSFLILFLGIVVTSMWFLPPLLSLHQLGLRDAWRLARKAEEINEWPIFVASYVPFSLVIILGLITEWSSIFSLIYLPFFSIYMYVSYRHVFLGKKENSPKLVKSTYSVLNDVTANQRAVKLPLDLRTYLRTKLTSAEIGIARPA